MGNKYTTTKTQKHIEFLKNKVNQLEAVQAVLYKAGMALINGDGNSDAAEFIFRNNPPPKPLEELNAEAIRRMVSIVPGWFHESMRCLTVDQILEYADNLDPREDEEADDASLPNFNNEDTGEMTNDK